MYMYKNVNHTATLTLPYYPTLLPFRATLLPHPATSLPYPAIYPITLLPYYPTLLHVPNATLKLLIFLHVLYMSRASEGNLKCSGRGSG